MSDVVVGECVVVWWPLLGKLPLDAESLTCALETLHNLYSLDEYRVVRVLLEQNFRKPWKPTGDKLIKIDIGDKVARLLPLSIRSTCYGRSITGSDGKFLKYGEDSITYSMFFTIVKLGEDSVIDVMIDTDRCKITTIVSTNLEDSVQFVPGTLDKIEFRMIGYHASNNSNGSSAHDDGTPAIAVKDKGMVKSEGARDSMRRIMDEHRVVQKEMKQEEDEVHRVVVVDAVSSKQTLLDVASKAVLQWKVERIIVHCKSDSIINEAHIKNLVTMQTGFNADCAQQAAAVETMFVFPDVSLVDVKQIFDMFATMGKPAGIRIGQCVIMDDTDWKPSIVLVAYSSISSPTLSRHFTASMHRRAYQSQLGFFAQLYKSSPSGMVWAHIILSDPHARLGEFEDLVSNIDRASLDTHVQSHTVFLLDDSADDDAADDDSMEEDYERPMRIDCDGNMAVDIVNFI